MHSHGLTGRSAWATRHQWVYSFASAALLAALAVIVPLSRARALDRKVGGYTSGARTEFVVGIPATRAVAPASLIAALAAVHRNIPAFSRQTGLACSSCHYQFPQLTPFGRLFKLNGYTLTGLQTIGQPGDSAGKESKVSAFTITHEDR